MSTQAQGNLARRRISCCDSALKGAACDSRAHILTTRNLDYEVCLVRHKNISLRLVRRCT